MKGIGRRLVSPAAVVLDRKSCGPDSLLAAEDVLQGVVTKAVAAEVLIIIGLEKEGAVFLLETVAASEARRGLGVGFGRVAAKVVGRRSRRPGIVSLPIAVAVPVVDAVRVKAARVVVCFSFNSRSKSRGRGVETATQEFLGGGQAMVGLELLEVALHHVHQEADSDATAFSFLADQCSEVMV